MKRTIFIMALLTLTSAANAMSSGHYEQKLGDGSTDILIIDRNSSMNLELTRQVGGPGGLTNDGVVPYPTVCRIKQWGKILSEDAQYVQYQVQYVHLADLTGLGFTQNCERYVGEFNGRALSGEVRFSIKKSEYTLTK